MLCGHTHAHLLVWTACMACMASHAAVEVWILAMHLPPCRRACFSVFGSAC